jgi:hypothetical protein
MNGIVPWGTEPKTVRKRPLRGSTEELVDQCDRVERGWVFLS